MSAAVETGDELPGRDVVVTRADLVRYAGASGDLNPIHWNERVAVDAGLPDVIAHGMYTMALAAQYVADGVFLRRAVQAGAQEAVRRHPLVVENL